MRFGFALLFCPAFVACASMQPQEQAQRHCPLGDTTEISITSPRAPREFALATAARAALRDGYEKFWIVKSSAAGDDYTMLIRMIPNDDSQILPDMIVAKDILAASTAPLPQPTL